MRWETLCNWLFRGSLLHGCYRSTARTMVSRTVTKVLSVDSMWRDDRLMASDAENRGHQGLPSNSDEGSYQGPDQLAQQLSDIARNLHRKDTLQDTLGGIVCAAVSNVPGAQFAG